MPKIRVMVVDDSVVIRRMLSDELGRDPMIEVVAAAPHGRIALARMPMCSPDVVVLDVEMPELDGLATLAELRKCYPKVAVIMFSALTERGASATLDALSLGAADYFTKPVSDSGMEASLEIVRTQLIPKIKALGPNTLEPAPRPIANRFTRPGVRPAPIHAVAIGTSTGGPNALTEIISKLPANFPVPILIVQHMPPMFTRLLAERLTAQSALKVQEAVSGTAIQPGEAWIAPGDYHMTVVRDGTKVRLLTHHGPPEHSCRPAVDVLLRSVAKIYGANSLNVILTGMGQDGLRGCEELRNLGAQILAQDEATSVVWGMPGYVAQAGFAERVLPLRSIAGEIVQRVGAS